MSLKLNRTNLLSSPGPAVTPVLGGNRPKFSMISNVYCASIAREEKKLKSPKYIQPNKHNFKVKSPFPPEKVEIFKSMESWAKENILTLLKPVDKCWQPHDLLPDPTSEGFVEKVNELRERAKELPDDYYVVLVGDMITEEALPTYQSHLSTTEVFGDGGCTADSPWAVWIRAWSAEEDRHGDLLSKYLYLYSGRVDMREVEKTIQHLIGRGMDIGSENNPYLWTIYTSFQERATAIAHGNTGKQAMQYGDSNLARICGTIASDEKRHEAAYSKISKKLFELDPDESVVAFAQMMRRKIIFPSHFMYDGQDDDLFRHFSSVTMRTGVYTIPHYVEILEHLIDIWGVEKLEGLSSNGREAQEYLCGLAQRIRTFQEREQKSNKESPTLRFSWIFNKEVQL